jgi:hypothetical protein
MESLLTKHSLATALSFVNANICIGGDSNGSKSSYGPVLHSYIWMAYRKKCLNVFVPRQCRLDIFRLALTCTCGASLTQLMCVFSFACSAYGCQNYDTFIQRT